MRHFAALLVLAAALPLAAQQPAASGPTSTVVYVGGDDLVVKSADGQLLSFTIPSTYRLSVGGKDTPLSGVKPGATITKPITPGTPPRVISSVSVVKGKVYLVSAPTSVTLALPTGNKEFSVPQGTSFLVGGKSLSIADLQTDMVVEATIITPAEPAAAPVPAPATPHLAGALLVARSDAETAADLPLAGTNLPLFGLVGATLLAAGLALLTFTRRTRQA